jgi:hypothetical protein
VNIKTVLLLSATLLLAQSAAIADEEKNKQWKEQDTWYQFTDKEQNGGFHTGRATTHGSASTAPAVVTPTAPAASDNTGEVLSVPYILQPGQPAPAPATTHIETTFEPYVQPGSVALPFLGGITPYYHGGGWAGNGFWGGTGFGLGAPYAHGGWRAPLGVYPSPAQLTFRPISRLVQSGPSKASGNYFNPSTPDPTASGSYYAGSGNTPTAVPVYQPEAQSKDYWGKQGSPLPPEMQPE